MPDARSKYWTFTLNNYTDADVEHIRKIREIFPSCTYLVFGREVGEAGTPHLQGYLEFDTRRRFTIVKNLLAAGGRCHIEKRRRNATSQQNRDYCTKDGDFEEFGTISEPEPGKRTDIEVVRESILNGGVKTGMDLLMKVTTLGSLQYGAKLLASLTPPKRSPVTVYWLHGATGTGKSRAAFDFSERMAENSIRTWISIDSSGYKWFDGYIGQEIAIFDDFRTVDVPFSRLLRLLDRYPLSVEVKGATTWWVPKWIIITTPLKLRESFGHLSHNEDLAQLERRVTRQFEFTVDAEGNNNDSGFSQIIDQWLHPVEEIDN